MWNTHVGAEFQQWMQQQSEGVTAQKKEFQEYKDKRDKEFTAFLKTQWKPVDIVKGEVLDESPKPVVMPVAEPPPVPPAPPAKKPVVISLPKPAPVKKPIAGTPFLARMGNDTRAVGVPTLPIMAKMPSAMSFCVASMVLGGS